MRSFSHMLPRALGAAAVALSLLAASASPTQAAVITFNGTFASEVPGASSGTGSLLLRFDTSAHTMFVDVAFSGLTGVTTVAHIHCCTATPGMGPASVATTTPTFPGFPVGVRNGTFTQTFDMTLASSYRPAFLTSVGGNTAAAEQTLINGLSDGRAYFNIHTNTSPGGEIRAFPQVPEPGTMALIGTALAGLVLRRRRE